MLTSPTHLRDALVALDADLGLLPGRRLALLGLRDPNATRLAENLRTLQATPAWTLVDARPGGAGGALREALGTALAAPKVALLVDATAPIPADADRLICALHDSCDTVAWSDGALAALPSKRMLFVIALGARAANELPPLLARIDFMTFIRPPD